VATYVKYENFVEDLANGLHDFMGSATGTGQGGPGTDTIKVALSNTAPDVAAHTVLAQAAEISAGNGYTAGGQDVQGVGSRSGGTFTFSGTDVVWTASGGSMATARYVILYNDTPNGPTDPLIAYWDYGAGGFTLAVGETLTVDFGAAIFTIT
jgi:hypothetical protein